MRELNVNEIQEVNGGILFMVVPVWAVAVTLSAEAIIIASIALD
ncbi:hypothetical protein ORJ66_15190 [Pseudoalteromonas tunicata]|nr:hypothetical protein [Pseudoalteromonas tunicata]MDP5214399.1 hypothetical protein [Pseudoalteromonas tunicata]